MIDDVLVQQLNNLQKQVDGLIKPEVSLRLISESILTGSVASVTFSSLPSGFRHLLFITHARTDAAIETDVINCRFNGDTGNNYDLSSIYTSGATPTGLVSRAATFIQIAIASGANARASNFEPSYFYIFNYALTTHEKHTFGLLAYYGNVSADADVSSGIRAGRWRNTNAITTVLLYPNSGPNFVSGSRFCLYGAF